MSLIAKFAAKKAASSSTPTVPASPAAPESPMPKATKRAEEAKTIPTTAVIAPDPYAIFSAQGSDDANGVLDIIADKITGDAPQHFDGPFPLVKLAKGNSGGSWVFGGNVTGEAAAVLPVAKNAFTAQFLGYRLYGVAWATGSSGNAPSGSAAETPIWKFQAASSDKALVQTVLDAGEAYQYCKGAEKAAKYDNVGHMRPGVELLFYRKGTPFVVRLPDHYVSTIRTLESLGSVMRGVGGLRAIPLVCTPYSTEEKGASPWKCHALRVEAAITAEGKAVAQEFETVKADLLADEEFKTAFQTWNTSEVTDEARQALTTLAQMKQSR